MSKKNNLSVRPVRRTKKPGYPSWQEPNPLEQPYAQPYPFTQKALNWLAASGVCGALFLLPEAAGSNVKQADKMESVDRDTLGNPFPFERMGVPFQSVSFGTGLPERISEKEAKAVIDSVFRAEGFHLQKKVVQAADGLVELDGFDPAQNIGYVWIGWGRMGDGMAISWRNRKDLKAKTEKTKSPERWADREIWGYEKSIKKIFDSFSKDRYPSEAQVKFAQKLKTMIDNGQPDWKDEYRFMFYEYMLEERLGNYEKYNKGKFPILIKYMRSILYETEEKNRNEELDKAMNVLHYQNLYFDWMSEVLIKTANGKRPASKLKRLELLQNAYKQFTYYDASKEEKLKHLIIEGKDNWKPAVKQAEQWLDELKISMDEAWALEADAYKDGQFVALICPNDERMIYRTTVEWVDQMRQSALESIKKQAPKLDSIELEKRADLWYGKPDYSDTKEYVLKNLEKHVLDYIHWAKQQRGY